MGREEPVGQRAALNCYISTIRMKGNIVAYKKALPLCVIFMMYKLENTVVRPSLYIYICIYGYPLNGVKHAPSVGWGNILVNRLE